MGANPRCRAGRRTRVPLPAAHPRKILVPVDFSPQSATAIKYASQLAGVRGSKIVLLHVVELIHYVHDFGYGPVNRQRTDEPAVKHAYVRLGTLGRKLLGARRTWTAEVRSGAVCEEIAEAARELNTELIVMPTRGVATTGQAHPESTAGRVICQSPCPVLALRKPLPARNQSLSQTI